jgi:hypothetical protein
VRVSFVDEALETGLWPATGKESANLGEKQLVQTRFQGPKATNVTHTSGAGDHDSFRYFETGS